MAAGSIVVDLLMRTGSFETDTARATKAAEKRLKELEKSARELGEQIGGALRTGILALGAAAVAAGVGFDQLIKGAADFKDLEEMTGASAESLASFAVSAATAGVTVESIGGAMNKLTKSLVGVDDESKAAGAALAALGINVADFKRLDPAAQYEAVGKALGGFADGAGKTAVAMALFGKSGAEQLKVFKVLEEAGERQIVLTQAQIERADAYADSQAKAVATLKLYAQAIATDMLPALTDVVTALSNAAKEFVGVNDAATKLGGNTGPAAFAEGIVNAFGGGIDVIQVMAREVEKLGVTLGARAAQISSFSLKDFILIGKEAQADLAKIDARPVFSEFIKGARAARKEAEALAGFAKTASSFGGGGGKPQLDFAGAQKPKGGGEKQSEAEKYLDTLEKQYEATLDFTEAEKALAAIQAGRLKGITPQLQEQILAQAQLNDEAKAFEKTRKDQIDNDAKFAKQALANIGALEQQNQRMRDEIELIGLEGAALTAVENARISSAIAIKQEAIARLEAAGANEKQFQVLEREIELLKERQRLNSQKDQAEFDDTRRKQDLDSFRKQQEEMRREAEITGRAIESALGDTLGLALEGKFDDIEKYFVRMLTRMAIQAAASQAAKAIQGWASGVQGDSLYTKETGEGGGSGWAGIIASVIGAFGGSRAGGGDVMAGSSYLVGEQGPERFVPRTAGTILPTSQTMGTRVERNINVTVQGQPNMSRATLQQQGADIGIGIRRSLSRNT